MKIYKPLLIAIINLYCSFTFAQTKVSFSKEITELNTLGKQIINSKNDEEKYAANEKYKTILKSVIRNNASFTYNFDSLKTISILQANKLKIYNWTIPLTDGTYKYFAFLQIKQSKDKFNIIELTDKSASIKSPENRILTNKNWYGALYYKLIYNKNLGKNYYTLLGWDGNNLLTNKKIIDVINISMSGTIKFGAPIFKTPKKTKKRIIFEYAEDAIMSVKYHPNIEKIVFDFLEPTSSKLKGVYEYYGPVLNRFDALFIENHKWVYEKDIKIELDKSIKDFMWKDPKEQ